MRDAREEKQLVSFFVPMGPKYSIDAIRKHLKAKLPLYAVPSVICPIKAMPLTPNGKVDSRKLPYPDSAIIMAQKAAAAAEDDSGQEEVSPLERKVLEVWERVLGRPVQPSDNFFDVGGHSILATQLTFALRTAFRQELPLNLLYQHPTARALATALSDSFENALAEMPTASRQNAETIDPAAEVVLDPAIARGDRPLAPAAEPRVVFLTGGTGFLGAFLLAELLRRFPDAVVRCLVRAKDDSAGFERLATNLRNHLLWSEAYAPRIVPVVGDLGKPLFGLPAAEFAALAEAADAIYHNGAMVHWVYPYSKLKPMNVGGTAECLRLATAGSTVASVFFVSSTSVFDGSHYAQFTEVPEDDALEGGGTLTVGYGQSKWIAERLVMLASSRGVPTVIFRPGYITGHSSTGVTNVDDYLVRLMKGCLQLGRAPQIRNEINACPADFVAAAIVQASTDPATHGHNLHIANPTKFRFSDLFEGMRAHGYAVEFEDYLAWRSRLMDYTLTAGDNALYPLLHFVLDDLPTQSKSPPLSTTRMTAALAGTGIECPALQTLMGTYLAHLVAVAFIDAPTGTGADVQALPAIDVGGGGAVGRSERKL